MEQHNFMNGANTPKKTKLEMHWNESLAKVSPGYQKALTNKERGQLKMLADQVGAQTSELIEFAIKRWVKFASHAYHQAGLHNYPSSPHIGFLLEHHGVAMNMLLESTAPPKAVETFEKSAERIFHEQLAIEKAKPENQPYRPTLEEIQRDLAMLGNE